MKKFYAGLFLITIIMSIAGLGSAQSPSQDPKALQYSGLNPEHGQPGPYEVVLFQESFMVPMRDGVKLATDIYRPAQGGKVIEEKLPLILARTPYNKKQAKYVKEGKFFASHGYVVAIQDCRGTYKSEGVFTKYLDEPNDGHDAVIELAKLPYTTGAVGMWGLSYVAHTQAGAAKLNPAPLKTIIVNMGGTSNGWTHAIRSYGAFELKQATWALAQIANETDDPVVKEMLKLNKTADWFAQMPWRKGLSPLAVVPNFEEYFLEMMTHSDYDDYWKHIGTNWSEYWHQSSNIPMIHISGWYDSYAVTAVDNYLGLKAHGKGPQYLMLGPWLHGATTQTHAGDVDFGKDSVIADFYDNFQLTWFDYFLKGKKNKWEKEPNVKLFIMGTGDGHKTPEGRLYHGGYWRSERSWPLPGTQFSKYYLHYDGSLSTKQPGAHMPPTTYTYDPEHPVPTIGGSLAASKPVYVGGAFDQREREFKGDPEKGFYGSRPPYLPLKSRPDVVVFQTEPLKEDTEVTGPIVVKIRASSTALDTDFTAKLVDVYPISKEFPSGFEMNLTDGIIRARYRNSWEKQEMMKPGEIYEFTINLYPTANVFKKGHRIRIDISSSNFPKYDVNPNTGEPLGMSRRKVKADNTIYHDMIYSSHAILPIIPKGRKQ